MSPGTVHGQVTSHLWRHEAPLEGGARCASPSDDLADVVHVARKREDGQSLRLIANDFGIAESC